MKAAAPATPRFATVIDARDDHAVAFYRSFSATPHLSRPKRLFPLTLTAAAALARMQLENRCLLRIPKYSGSDFIQIAHGAPLPPRLLFLNASMSALCFSSAALMASACFLMSVMIRLLAVFSWRLLIRSTIRPTSSVVHSLAS